MVTASVNSRPSCGDDAAPTQLTTLIFTNWYYTKMARREIFAHCTQLYGLIFYTKLSKVSTELPSQHDTAKD